MPINRDEDHVVLTELTQNELRQRLFAAGWKVGTADKFGQPETVTTNPDTGDWLVFRTYQGSVYFYGQVSDEDAFAGALGEEYERCEDEDGNDEGEGRIVRRKPDVGVRMSAEFFDMARHALEILRDAVGDHLDEERESDLGDMIHQLHEMESELGG